MARTVSFTTKGGKKVSFKAGHGKRAQAKANRAAFKKMGSVTTTDIYGGPRVKKVKIERKSKGKKAAPKASKKASSARAAFEKMGKKKAKTC